MSHYGSTEHATIIIGSTCSRTWECVSTASMFPNAACCRGTPTCKWNTFSVLPPSQGRSHRLQAAAWRTAGLQRVPYEIISYILQDLTLDDVFSLAQTSRHFLYLIREESLCKMLLKIKAPHSLEAREAQQSGRYASALRRLVKRRRAIATASPYVVGILGFADSYVFCNGTLCYMVEDRPRRWLRILDLRKATNQELVVDVPQMIAEAFPAGTKICQKYTFKILHHASGITSCLFSFSNPDTENWLLIFNAQKQLVLGNFQLESSIRIFVRNDEHHLIFGTHSEYDTDGFRKWVLRYFDIRARTLSESKMYLTDVVGYEIGATVCFEIIDNYFYGCSNQTTFEIEEIDWTSYYYCFRFPLCNFGTERAQVMRRRDSWRRQHAEGPIDDRWSFLQLEQDELGDIKIIECRKEWLCGRSESVRTYYTKHVTFRDTNQAVSALPDEDSDDADPLPNDPLTSLLSDDDKPNYMEPPLRPTSDVHQGDDGSEMLSKGRTHLSTYFSSCDTYLDLVDDSTTCDPHVPRLRIRTGSRVLRSLPDGRVPKVDPHHHPAGTGEGNCRESQRRFISRWPPERPVKPNLDLDTLGKIMSPPGLNEKISAANDERSLVYATGSSSGGVKALIYLSFDPATRLAEAARAGTLDGERQNKCPQWESNCTCPAHSKGKGQVAAFPPTHLAYEKRYRGDQVHAPASALASIPPSPDQDLIFDEVTLSTFRNSWVTVQPAFHRNPNLGGWKYTFGYRGMAADK
ncbi:hypothetical protein BX600DRAFT_537368 [Xylariales sp. PMI_506]|nr:hypothetical protein BX600DRAFT_537368 [Xylariales sp. PMI_506]